MTNKDLSIDEIIDIVKKESKKSNESQKSSIPKKTQPFSSKESYTIEELCALHDRDFIKNAYLAFLKREADSEGFDKFLNDLRSGRKDKVQILSEIRFSDEGKRNGVKVPSLKKVYLINKLYKIPVLGYILKWFVTLLKLPKLILRMNEFEAYTNARFLDFEEKNSRFLHALEETEANIKNLYKKSEDYFGFKEFIQKELEHSKRDYENSINGLKEEMNNNLQKNLNEITTRQKFIDEKINSVMRENYEKIKYLEDTTITLNEDYRGFKHFVENKLKKLKEESLQDFTEFQNFKDNILTQQKDMRDNFYKVSEDYHGFKDYVSMKIENGIPKEKFEHLEKELFKKYEDYNGYKKYAQEKFDSLSYEITTKSQKEEIKELLKIIEEHKLYILDNQKRVSFILEELRKRLPKKIEKDQIKNVLQEEDHLLDAMYVLFEDRFRGLREDIKRRLRAYLPLLSKNKILKEALTVDLGCGRGEWLELLKEEGYDAVGIDLNRVMVEECRKRELKVDFCDALEYLKGLKDNSLSMISGFHIIEHLDFEMFVKVLDEAVRVLKQGGMILFETPNPVNLEVGTSEFYIDPSHKNPLHPKSTAFLIESRGFIDVGYYFIEHKELKSTLKDPKEYPLKTFEDFMKVPKDYVLTGYKA